MRTDKAEDIPVDIRRNFAKARSYLNKLKKREQEGAYAALCEAIING